MKTLYALLQPPLRLMDGNVYYYQDGEEFDVYALNKEERRKLRWQYIAYVPQGAMSIFNPVLLKIKETYRDFLSSHLSGKTRDEMFEIAKEHIERLGLPLKVPGSLSPPACPGVCSQRVAIALAALLKPAGDVC